MQMAAILIGTRSLARNMGNTPGVKTANLDPREVFGIEIALTGQLGELRS